MSIPPTGGDIPPYAPYDAGPAGVTQDDKIMALIAYIGGAFVSFIVPLILYLVKKDQSKFIAYHAMQAMIFHIAIIIAYSICGALTVVLIGFFLIPVVAVFSLVFSIIAALAANRGEWYEMPVVGKFAHQFSGI